MTRAWIVRSSCLGGLTLALLPAWWPEPATAQSCASPTITDLLVDQTQIIGVVEVCKDDSDLHVRYVVEDGWCMTKTHLHVAESLAGIPQNPRGKPLTGRFDHKSNHKPCADAFGLMVDVSDFVPGTELFVAAHATVSASGGRGKKSDAWADGPTFPDKKWATYFTHVLQEPLPCGQPEGSCTVFVTSSQQNGDLGGLAGADEVCNELAAEEDLQGSGSYLAWLSDADASPSTRFAGSAGPYRLVDGTLVADGWADLTDGTLQHPIDVLENGTRLTSNAAVWTATNPDGTLNGPITIGGPFCEEWTTGSNGRGGKIGLASSSDDQWTRRNPAGTVPCDRSDLRLYCFQQP